jgi:rhamnose transport system substrate-binding protein
MADESERSLATLTEDLMSNQISRRVFITRALVAGLSVTAIGAILAACSSSSTPAPATAASATAAPATAASATAAGTMASTAPAVDMSSIAKGLHIFHVPKFTGFIFFELARAGVDEACKELGAGTPGNTYVGPDKADTQQQVQVIQNILPQKPDCIIMAALDLNATSPALKQARDAGCVIVTYDSDVSADARDMFTNMMTYPDQAKSMLDASLVNFPDGGKAIWLAPTPSTGNFIEQKKALDALIASNAAKYGKIVFIDTLYMNDDPETSKKVSTDAMAAHPDLKYFISGSGMAIPAVNQAIEDTGNQGKVFAIGFALPSTMTKYLADGTNKMFPLWNPTDFGYLATQACVQKKAGVFKGAVGETFHAGRLGDRTIQDQNYVILGVPMFFTKDCPDFTSCAGARPTP